MSWLRLKRAWLSAIAVPELFPYGFPCAADFVLRNRKWIDMLVSSREARRSGLEICLRWSGTIQVKILYTGAVYSIVAGFAKDKNRSKYGKSEKKATPQNR